MASQDRILKALQEAREQVRQAQTRQREPIAVVGMGCRLPGGVDTPDKYWQLLCDGTDAMREVPPERWDLDEYYDPDPEAPGKVYAREGGWVDNIDLFDPQFFRISPREAQTLDPQQRLLLEVSWEALEDAGEAPDSLRGSNTGFYVGLSWHDYERNAYGMDPRKLDAYSAMGNTQSIAVGRLAFVLGAQGPTSLMDTACSASLVAVHTACQTLRSGEADMILAGGVNLMISPLSTIFCCKVKALSPDSRCKTFDAAADGYGRGEGCGMIVLKRLSDAVRDGNHIRAVIRGTAINHDGPSSGLTVPNRGAQVDVIKRALRNGDIDPLDVGYVEAHGTGTALGDPIEVGALGDALGKGRSADRPLRLGSAKTNFGHLEAAAGIAGLMKAILAVEHARIPPHLHFNQPSPHIDWQAYPVEVPTTNTEWLPGPRIAGVSSFGFSGTNAHMLVGEAPEPPADESTTREQHVLTLRARDESALRDMARDFAAHLATTTDAFPDICYTANSGRAQFNHRLALVADTASAATAGLNAFVEGQRTPGVVTGQAPARPHKLAFLFTGQGAQWRGMGRELYNTQPVFRESFDRCAAALADELEIPLTELVFGSYGEDDDPLNQTGNTQPALFALEWSLAQLWLSWGVKPSLLIGHSVGELVAACVAGVFSLEDGLKLVAARGRLMQSLPAGGAMVAVTAAEEEVARAVADAGGAIAVAAVNGPRAIVVSGAAADVERALAPLKSAGVDTRPLVVSHAFHSPLMDPILQEFEAVARGITYQAPQLSVISNLTGGVAGEALCDPAYWRKHIREAVRFADGMQALRDAGASAFLEVGPHPVLCGMGQQCLDDEGLVWASSLRRDESAETACLTGAAQLFAHGVGVDWVAFDGAAARKRVRLPSYPFQRRSYWVDADGYGAAHTLAGGATRSRLDHPLLGTRLASAALSKGQVLIESQLEREQPGWLADHIVFDRCVPPATAWMELVLASGRHSQHLTKPALQDVTVQQPLALPEQGATTVQCVLNPVGGGQYDFSLYSLAAVGGEWLLHASGRLVEDREGSDGESVAAETGSATAVADQSGEAAYTALRGQGLALGPSFQTILSVTRDGQEAWAEVALPETLVSEGEGMQIHPALLDACGQLVTVAFPPADDALFLPVGVDTLRVLRPGITRGRVRARLVREASPEAPVRSADIDLFDPQGRLAVSVRGAATRLAQREDVLRSLDSVAELPLYQRSWEKVPASPATTAPRCWLVFGDDALSWELAEQLRGRDARVLTVTPGDALDLAGDTLRVRSREPADWRAVVSALAVPENEQLGLVFAWSQSGTGSSPLDTEAGLCASVALLTQALASEGLIEHSRLWLMTRGVQAVDGDAVASAGASLWGLGAVLQQEHPELPCVRIDLPADADADGADAVLNEVLSDGSDDQVALRGADRFVAHLEEKTVNTKDNAVIRGDGCYLITGGLGALGLALAERLVEEGARHLVLIGRREPSADAQTLLAALREQGVNVATRACDVSDEGALSDLLSDIAASDSPLLGVFHTAGVLDDGVLLQMNEARMRQVMAAKVTGAWHLHALLPTLAPQLEHLVLFSSTASLLGSRGQGNYAAANAFLDSLAEQSRQAGLPALSVNWGPWGEVGMAAQLDELATRRMHDLGWTPMATRRGMDSLLRLMGSGESQMGVVPLDWSRFLQQFERVPGFFSRLVEVSATTVAGQTSLRDQLAETPTAERRTVVQAHLGQRVATLLAMPAGEQPDPSVTFQELGIDSLLHMELRSELGRDLGASIPVAEFLEHPSVEQLTELVLRRLALASVDAAGSEGEDDEEMEEFVL